MPQVPFQLRYTLTRMQRLVPHLRIWGVGWTLFVVVMSMFFCERTAAHVYPFDAMGIAVFGGLALFVLLLYRRLFIGFLDVLFVPARSMDVIVEDNAAGILIGTERWYLFLDGIINICKFREDTWTIQHFNGCVLNIDAPAIQEDQVTHLRDAMERGRTPEGIKAVIERGKRIKAIQESEREA
jgi:hypothetical protein